MSHSTKEDNVDEQKKVLERLRALMTSNGAGPQSSSSSASVSDGWDEAWRKGITPWSVQPVRVPLEYIMSKKGLGFPKGGSALVPGCGRGDDAVLLAKSGFQTLGIDLSPTAVSHSLQWIDSLPDKPVNLTIKVGNFFELVPPNDGFDIIYDYTFFCAFPPSVRPNLGETMTKLIRPGGFLITLVFPIDGDRPSGPPYSVSLDTYRDVLPAEQWEIVLNEVPPNVPDIHRGRAKIVVWKSIKH